MMNALRAEELSVNCRVATSLLVLGIAAMLGCAGKRDTENNVLRLRLEEGGSVGARLEAAARPGQVAAILVYEASMCFACSPYLTRWEELSRRKSVPLILLLREPPSPSERRAIRLQRVPVAWRASSNGVQRGRQVRANISCVAAASSRRQKESLKCVASDCGSIRLWWTRRWARARWRRVSAAHSCRKLSSRRDGEVVPPAKSFVMR